MTVEEIERLLAEFYEGNTNEQEEELLKEAFRTEEVPEHLQNCLLYTSPSPRDA